MTLKWKEQNFFLARLEIFIFFFTSSFLINFARRCIFNWEKMFTGLSSLMGVQFNLLNGNVTIVRACFLTGLHHTQHPLTHNLIYGTLNWIRRINKTVKTHTEEEKATKLKFRLTNDEPIEFVVHQKLNKHHKQQKKTQKVCASRKWDLNYT